MLQKGDTCARCRTRTPVYNQRTQPLLPSESQQTWPVLVKINVSMAAQDKERWWPVVCPKGHVTHAFLACDITSFCWAENNVLFSLSPESWASPMSQSCPVQLAVTSLPPSFPCRSQVQRIPYSLVCNHRRDCVDSSDETFCKFLPCQWQFQFQCLNKQVSLLLRLFMYIFQPK